MTEDQSARDQHFMTMVLDDAAAARAAGNVGVASLIVRGQEIIGRGQNSVATKQDPLAHAETEAIIDCYRRFGAEAMKGSTIYTTMEPCPMCAGAIHLAGLGRVVLGGRHASLARTDLGRYTLESFADLLSQDITVTTGVRQTECEEIRQHRADTVLPSV